MLGKVKDILGIEGVKLEIICSDVIPNDVDEIQGTIKLTTVREQVVKSVELKLIEKYARGRKDNRLIDEYVLGELKLTKPIRVVPGEEKLIEFSLDFARAKSAMDKLQDDSVLYRGIISVAKFFKKVKSSYRIEGNAKVKGVKLNPSAKKELKIRG